MADLLTVALAGTSAAGETRIESEAPVDALLAASPRGDGVERRLLLAAGAEAVYRLAGFVAPQASEPPIPAPKESMPSCSPAAAQLLRLIVVGEHEDLLPEALDRLRRASLRLPFELLPLALGRTEPELRAALLPVLGERGRWLSGFNRAWTWAAEAPAEGGVPEVPADAEAVWQEGSAARRVALLRRLRASDPARAREWVAAVWKQEKADFRQDMLRALAVGLGADDEPLIEAALDDRAAGVRAEAAELLARLPASAYTARMTTRGDALLVFKDGKLDARPPRTLAADAVRDGIAEKPPLGIPGRSWWLEQMLAHVPPNHWCERFSSPPDVLIAATDRSVWREAILAGWARAAALRGDRGWAAAVWNAWPAAVVKVSGNRQLKDDNLHIAIAHLLPPDILEHEATEALERAVTNDNIALDETLALLPLPWSIEIGVAYLRGLRARCERLAAASREAIAYTETLDRAAHALPAPCFAAALEPVTLPEENSSWATRQLRQQLDELSETIRLRMRLIEAIPVPDE